MYSILNVNHQQELNSLHLNIQFNEQHAVFSGHFPNQPIVPGVFWIQIIKNVLTKQQFHIEKVIELTNAKFLIPINPQSHELLVLKIDYRITENTISTMAKVYFNEQKYTELNIKFQIKL